ncbi:MAG: 3-phosphoshikimate 1-carboxyvinyltransferase [Flavobacteriales endosymbiont of Rhyzopertha dominica]|nr:MAG: 3-phosphoshikimate 1-carboxyvinyltransferase [Candidatus Shikimatogenerans bostrichidophilus]
MSLLSLKFNNNKIYNYKLINFNICGSKSESNRLLIIKKLFNKFINFKLFNLSNSNDTKIMQNILIKNNKKINVKDAGTVMRFLISYYSIINNNKIILTGNSRMQNRPVLELVKCLNKLGANIKYINKIGYPPLYIKGKNIYKNKIKINSNISSQYITSLILIAPKLKNGLKIILKNNNISFSYIKMTINIFKKINFKILFNNKKKIIIIPPINKYLNIKKNIKYYIESDWSSASYFYSIITLLNNVTFKLNNFYKNSLQGDNIIYKIYKKYFGIKTKFKKKFILIYKNKNFNFPKFIKLNLKSTPDIAQTIILTCSILKIKCLIKGLKTLKIKETDRLIALNKELKKIGINTKITNSKLLISKFNKIIKNNKIIINTYNDHRMAMSFSILAIKYNNIFIENPKTVNKSYPNFWKDLKKIGFYYNYI